MGPSGSNRGFQTTSLFSALPEPYSCSPSYLCLSPEVVRVLSSESLSAINPTGLQGVSAFSPLQCQIPVLHFLFHFQKFVDIFHLLVRIFIHCGIFACSHCPCRLYIYIFNNFPHTSVVSQKEVAVNTYTQPTILNTRLKTFFSICFWGIGGV